VPIFIVPVYISILFGGELMILLLAWCCSFECLLVGNAGWAAGASEADSQRLSSMNSIVESRLI
jgi:hypothetical protein